MRSLIWVFAFLFLLWVPVRGHSEPTDIFAVMDHVTTLLSRGQKIPEADREQLQKVIHSVDLSKLSAVERERLEAAGKRMFVEAQNLEDAVIQIRSLGFEQKFGGMSGALPPKLSFAWMLKQNPLPSLPIGQWPTDPRRYAINPNVSWGETAGELLARGKLQSLRFTHGTPEYESWNSLISNPDGKINAFYSGREGRTASTGFFLYPAGGAFERQVGPYLVLVELDPNARLGVDFLIEGSDFIFYNRSPLTVINDFGEYTPMGLLERLRNYRAPLSPLHLGPLEKHRRKFVANQERLSADEIKRLNQIFTEDFEAGRLNPIFMEEIKLDYSEALTPRNRFRLNELWGGGNSLALLNEAQKKEAMHWDWASQKVNSKMQMTESEILLETVKLNLNEARRPGSNVPKNFTRLDVFLVQNTSWVRSPHAGKIASILAAELSATRREHDVLGLLKSGVISADWPESLEVIRNLSKLPNMRDPVVTDILLSKAWIGKSETSALLREISFAPDFSGWAKGVTLLPRSMTDPQLIESDSFGKLALDMMPEISKPHPYFEGGRSYTQDFIQGSWKNWLRALRSNQWEKNPYFSQIKDFLMNYHDIHYLVAREMLSSNEWAKTEVGAEMLLHLIRTGRSEGDIVQSVLILEEWAKNKRAGEILKALVDGGKVNSEIFQLLSKSAAWRRHAKRLGLGCASIGLSLRSIL